MQLRQSIIRSALIVGLAFATSWTIDSTNAKVTFKVKGIFGTVNGSFTGLKATIKFDENDLPGSAVQASIDPTTVSTGSGLRDRHLKNEEEWFNPTKYPAISFKSQKIEKGTGGYKAIGDLTMKGVTKPTEIPFTFTPNGGTGVFKGQFTIKREDFNIGKPGGSVGDIITINLEVPVKK
jgi:polyisoprenoid-binding protein YceI